MQAQVHSLEGKPYHPDRLIQPADIAAMVISALRLPRTAEVTECIRAPDAERLNRGEVAKKACGATPVNYSVGFSGSQNCHQYSLYFAFSLAAHSNCGCNFEVLSSIFAIIFSSFLFISRTCSAVSMSLMCMSPMRSNNLMTAARCS